jgi:curli biogenesis system outer membrane secretion channel CsgG
VFLLAACETGRFATTDRETVEKLLGERRADRFAEAFLDVLRKAG